MSSRRSSRLVDSSSELTLECKAAFLSIFDDISDKIESKRKLNNVLQQSGRNPTTAAMNKYWPRGTDELSFDDFVDICRKEPVTSADDLMKAFRKIDINGDGYISLDELYKIMNKQGENMTRDDVRKMIAEVDENNDGKLDYSEFTNMIIKTTEESKKFSMKVMEKKERKKKRVERLRDEAAKKSGNYNEPVNESNDDLKAISDETGEIKGAENMGSSVSVRSNVQRNKMGSVTSLRSKRDHDMEDMKKGDATEGGNMGSSVSIRSNVPRDKLGSVASLRSNKGTENMGSRATLTSNKGKESTGSQASLRSTQDAEKGSTVSLKSKENFGSKVSIGGDVRSIKEHNQGSNVTLRSVCREENETDPAGYNEISKKEDDMESFAYKDERSESPNISKHDDHSTKSSPRKDSPRVSPRSRTDSGSQHRSGSGSRARSDSDSKSGLKKGTTPRESARRDSGAKETPRRDSSARNEKPPLPDSPRSEKAKSLKHDKPSAPKENKPSTPKEKDGHNHLPQHKDSHVTFKKNLPIDSARSVGEEISFDDDFDIISTGRPTPRFDLNTKTDQTPRAVDKDEKKEADKGETPSTSKTGKHTKGNSSDTLLASHALANSDKDKENRDEKLKVSTSKSGNKIHKNADADNEKRDDSDTDKAGDSARARRRNSGSKDSKDSSRTIKKTGELDDLFSSGRRKGSATTGSKRGSLIDDLFNTSSRSEKPEEGLQDTTSFVDEIFKSSRSTRSVLSREYDLMNQGTGEEDSKDKKSSEKNSMSAKEGKDAKKTSTGKLNENGFGSQTSLRSGGKDSVPVPSPRKSVSRLSEDDVPRPSPRVKRDGKTKSSSKHKDELPDARSLRDWQHYTSKGCFFYEEEEIVTHVYNLTLNKDSSVYLSAHPCDSSDAPKSLNLPEKEPIDTALFVFDSDGQLVTFTEIRDTKGTYGVKCELSAGTYQVLPYTTGCRFKQRPEDHQHALREAKLVKTKDDKVAITTAFRRALEDIFDLCDLDGNGTMSKDEFNWFNLRTSGEELGDDEWEVVEEKTELDHGEITKAGFIELNEMEAEDAEGEEEDLWITLTSMGLNKGLIMDEACPYRVDVYVEDMGRKKPSFMPTGIESLEKDELASEICKYMMDKAGDQTKVRNMKDLYMYTYKNELRSAIIIDNRSRSSISLQVDCRRSKNVVSNRPDLDYTLEINPQSTAIAHHLLPKNELSDWTVSCTETIHK